ncbi:hypothetical protein [Corallococcus llansteffanensis]|uniref:Lipoprotein n=1 Tax=Corallococcus llansteffanensis TaxID=2316731 RepID=A0A3A8PM39_9BACT|nr:hypothetical protein [Corallococcus llansteffanensis]RKH54735.1 hypothetical protein D7V93_24850 [Corallococcus llansteffanensis]
MRKSILSTLVILGTAGSLTACDFEQPNAGCIVQDASFATWWAKYDAVGTPTGPGGAPCTDKLESGDNLGVWKFANPETGTANLVIRPQAIARLGAADANNEFGSLQVTGDLSTTTDADDFCTAQNFNIATVNPTQAGVVNNLSYTVANVKVYSSPSSPGTQMTGEVTYTRNNCTSKYVMRAVWPATVCDPAVDQTDPDLGFANCGAGSGINPDFATTCELVEERFWTGTFDPDPEDDVDYPEGRCVPTKAIPSFK